MTITADEFRTSIDADDELARLLDSSARLSYDPQTEVDWETPLNPAHYGLNPEWSTLYGTKLWDEMTEQQRVTLTRHEVGSIMGTGIWFEMILQQMLLREQYTADVTGSEFQFALTEIADECRHSLMFARACQTMGVPHYVPSRPVVEAARALKTVAANEVAYGSILVAEEILDVMQRDWMRGENVLPIVRTTSKIHVVEEARHMKFARHEIREHLEGVSPLRRRQSAWVIASAAFVIVKSMVNPAVYEAAGLDRKRALAEAKANEHHHALMRQSCVHLMDFLSESGLLTPAAMRRYRAVHML
jgi:hypothetical protein